MSRKQFRSESHTGTGRFRLVVALGLAVSLLGCAASVEVSRYERFATAGERYTDAVDSLLLRSSKILVDANSEKLLDSRELAIPAREDVRTQDAVMRENLVELRLFRRHLWVLRDYFSSLTRLATSEAPRAFATEVEGTATALNGLSTRLREQPLLGRPETADRLSAGIGELVIRNVQLKALEDEFEKRKQTIAETLLLHEAFLDALRDQLESDLEIVQERRYGMEVLDPFVDEDRLTGNAEQSAWVVKRREFLLEPRIIPEFDRASRVAQDLRHAWKELLAGGVTVAHVEGALTEIETLLSTLQELQADEIEE